MATFLLLVPTAHAIELPEMGASAATMISPEQERAIGKEMMRSLRRSGKVVDDLELEAYVKGLGYQLLSASGQHSSDDFTFFLLDDPAINAFAMPGGYVGVHTGLLLTSANESELAAVVAHEISHVTQRHLVRGYEKATNMNLPVTAAVIAAIVLGAYNPALGEAALAASIAGSMQMQLDFSRDHEQEADRVGIELLAQAGFDPKGMPSFFERLHQETRYFAGAPEFLSTHPVTASRIADSRSRASQFGGRQHTDALAYHLAKAQLKVIGSHNPAALVKELEEQRARKNHPHPEVLDYSYALALRKSGNLADAQKVISKLVSRHPDRIAFLRAEAYMTLEQGNVDKAFGRYRHALALYPGNAPLTIDFAEALIDTGNIGEASRILREFTHDHPSISHGFELLARAEQEQGQTAAANLALAEYYHSLDETMQAIDQLQLARREKNVDFYYASRIEARLQQFIEEQNSAPTLP